MIDLDRFGLIAMGLAWVSGFGVTRILTIVVSIFVLFVYGCAFYCHFFHNDCKGLVWGGE